MEKENVYYCSNDEEILEDRFEDLYEYDLFDLLADVDEDVCDRSRTELEINPHLARILTK